MPTTDRYLLQEFTKHLSLTLEGMLGEPWTVTEEGEVPSRMLPGTALHVWAQTLSSHPDPCLRILTPPESWNALGKAALLAAGIEGAGSDDILSTYREMLTQSIAGMARALSVHMQREVTLTEGREETSAPSPGRIFKLLARGGSGEASPLYLAIQEAALQTWQLERPTAEPPAGELQVLETVPASLPEEPPSSRIDFLLDVELPVSVSFGRSQLPLRDVIKLTTGSIVELDRNINEPVEVIVNNCVIARGEVVVVEGNYGVRINEIVSRTERIRSFD